MMHDSAGDHDQFTELNMPPEEQSDAAGLDSSWVIGQTIMFLLAIVLPPLERLLIGAGYEIFHPLVSIILGIVVIIAAVWVSNQSRVDLGDNLRPAPTPINGGRLIDQGIYSRVRHPMYLGAILAVLGWALVWSSWAGLVMTILTYLFFNAKSRYEERLLVQRYPSYAQYRQRVPGRFIPMPSRG